MTSQELKDEIESLVALRKAGSRAAAKRIRECAEELGRRAMDKLTGGENA